MIFLKPIVLLWFLLTLVIGLFFGLKIGGVIVFIMFILLVWTQRKPQ